MSTPRTFSEWVQPDRDAARRTAHFQAFNLYRLMLTGDPEAFKRQLSKVIEPAQVISTLCVMLADNTTDDEVAEELRRIVNEAKDLGVTGLVL